MATIEKRGKFWRVKIRRQGAPAQTRTFDNKTVAQQWARSIETELDSGIVIDRRPAERTTLAEVLERYRRDVTPTKRGARDENLRLKAMALRPFARIRMAAITSSYLAAYRDQRLKVVSSIRPVGNGTSISHSTPAPWCGDRPKVAHEADGCRAMRNSGCSLTAGPLATPGWWIS